jgi:serine/threonine-protein kinase HipA
VAKALRVHLHGHAVGRLTQGEGGRLSFAYDPAYLKQADAQPVSLALPLAETDYDHKLCHAVFGGMLPEGDVRIHLAKALGVSAKNDFSLLAEIGGDCAGAVSLWPEQAPLRHGSKPGRALDGTALGALLKQLPRNPMLIGEGVRLSLAGAQNKLALTGKPGAFRLPTDAEPSTHILKLAPEGYDGILINELFCMRLAAQLGLPAAKAGILDDAGRGTACLWVERFDRDAQGGRLHQEDFCQALGVAPETKYQADGGPGLTDCVGLLRRHSRRLTADLAAFLKLVYFNYLVGNADAHAKNFSLLLQADGPRLAPAYDLLSTAVYPQLAAKMAMKIGGEGDPQRLAPRHWERLAQQCDVKAAYVLDGLRELAAKAREQAPMLASAMESESGPDPIYAALLAVIRKRADKVIA